MSSADQSEKKRSTMYLPEETIKLLEKAWIEIRHETGQAVSRSDIIEASLLIALQDGDYRKVIDTIAQLR
jgi:hypothetical protein